VQLSIWSGTCYVTPLIGAYLADASMGRFWVIITFSITYLIVSAGAAGATQARQLGPPAAHGTARSDQCAARRHVHAASARPEGPSSRACPAAAGPHPADLLGKHPVPEPC
jgi:hypothetical protein